MVRLLSVPFSNDYKHTKDFTSKEEQTSYMLSKQQHSYDKFTYQRQERTLKVPANIDSILNCNYVMYQNLNFNTKWFYAFITSKRYINPNTTELTLETDVFQTWQFEMVVRQSFIERKHVDRWNVDGSPVVNTVDEGLNYGIEYDIVDIQQVQPQDGIYFLVIASKETLHKPGGAVPFVSPKINGTIQPLSYYIHPFTPDGVTPPISIGGTSAPLATIEEILKTIYEDAAAVNNVVSLYITDNIGVNVQYDGTIHLETAQFSSEVIGDSTTPIIYVYDLPAYEVTLKNIGDKYSGYTEVTESKLLMYPYTQLILSDSKGHQVALKNEYVNGSTLAIASIGSLGTSNKVAYYVDQYLNLNTLDLDHVADLEHAVINDDSNNVPIITDLLSAYLQGNRNSIELNKAQINFNKDMGNVISGLGAARSFAGDVLHGNVVGGLGEAASNTLHMMQNSANADFKLQAINSKMQDIQNTPPSISNMGSNTAFDFGNGYSGVFIIKKEITDEYRYKLLDYFKAYGYQLNKMQTPEWKSREHFNYIKTIGVNIQGDIPSDDLNLLKAIFDKGITIWHVDDVGNYNLTNNEVS